MKKVKAGVVVVTKFCRPEANQYGKYVDYIDRDEAIRQEHDMEYNLYADYMGNPEKTTGLFTEDRDSLSISEKKMLKENFRTAQKNGSLMWQTVISFDNQWLQENGIYDYASKQTDERKLKEITRNAVGKMLKNEGLENALWSASIHYNTDNIHIHVATVEPVPMRRQKEYIQYRTVERDGESKKEAIFDLDGKPVKKMEYVGRFQGKSIEKCKSSVVNQILRERESNIRINSIIRESILEGRKKSSLLMDKKFKTDFLELYSRMPDVDTKMWNYNSSVMAGLLPQIDRLTEKYLKAYHAEEYKELKQELRMQGLEYQKAYGGSREGNDYAEGKLRDLYARMGNTILKEIRQYDRFMKREDQKQREEWKGKRPGTGAMRKGWLTSRTLQRLRKALDNDWEKRMNEREHEKLTARGEDIGR